MWKIESISKFGNFLSNSLRSCQSVSARWGVVRKMCIHQAFPWPRRDLIEGVWQATDEDDDEHQFRSINNNKFSPVSYARKSLPLLVPQNISLKSIMVFGMFLGTIHVKLLRHSNLERWSFGEINYYFLFQQTWKGKIFILSVKVILHNLT